MKTLKQKKQYSISEAAEVLGVSIHTLRMYEREGLIIPTREELKHRRFTEDDLERVRCMRKMINHDKVSIQGIKHLMSLVPCWKIKDCPEAIREACPAFIQHANPCWKVKGRLWECKDADCHECPVYKDFTDCSTLKKTIATYTLGKIYSGITNKKKRI